MTHLRVEQNTITENVTSDVIHKLYETAKAIIDAEEANDVQESQVSLKGNLQVGNVYDDEVSYLESKFPDLHVLVTGNRYVSFKDQAIANILAIKWGDGFGVTRGVLDTKTEFPKINAGFFSNNTNITDFSDLSIKIPTITNLGEECFQNCSNLTYVDCTNITYCEARCFKNSGITELYLPNCTDVRAGFAYNCGNLEEVILPKVTRLYDASLSSCPKLKRIFIGSAVTALGNSFGGTSNVQEFVITATTPPSVSYIHDIGRNARIYVPDSSIDAYKLSWTTVADLIYGISQYTGTLQQYITTT